MMKRLECYLRMELDKESIKEIVKEFPNVPILVEGIKEKETKLERFFLKEGEKSYADKEILSHLLEFGKRKYKIEKKDKARIKGIVPPTVSNVTALVDFIVLSYLDKFLNLEDETKESVLARIFSDKFQLPYDEKLIQKIESSKNVLDAIKSIKNMLKGANSKIAYMRIRGWLRFLYEASDGYVETSMHGFILTHILEKAITSERIIRSLKKKIKEKNTVVLVVREEIVDDIVNILENLRLISLYTIF